MSAIKNRVMALLHRPVFHDSRTLLALWMVLPVISALLKIHKHNNFLVFRGVFWHSVEQTSLYAAYPDEYYDFNYYGPFFGLVIAPFALLPEWVGLLMWLVALSMCLYLAIRYLPLTDCKRIAVYWFCAHELLTALFMSQFNIATAASVILAFACIERERDGWAAFFIVAGTMVKLYSVVGLAFFFFSKHKLRFVLSLIAWTAVTFVAPMALSSPEFVISQYGEWAERIAAKDGYNMFSLMQNISLLGIVRKLTQCATYSDLCIIIPGLILFALPYLRVKQYANLAFRYALLASVLMFVVLFSTGSESSSYITAFVGVALWYWTVPWKRGKWDVALMIFAFIITSMSPSDLFPAWLRRNIIQPYALKALPIAIIWFKLCYEMMTKDYASHSEVDRLMDSAIHGAHKHDIAEGDNAHTPYEHQRH